MYAYCSNCGFSTEDYSTMQELERYINFLGGSLMNGECPECFSCGLRVD